MKSMRKLLILAVVALMAGTVSAQRVQFGVRAGVFSQDMELKFSDAAHIMSDAKLGWSAAFVSRVRITAIGSGAFSMGLYLQPEVVYSQNGYKMQKMKEVDLSDGSKTWRPDGSVVKVSMRDVDIPVMLSFQLAIIRLQAGPVFNVMHKTPAKRGDVDVMSIRPTVGYSFGASVDIFGGLVLDGRYNGNFKKMKNNIQMGDKVFDSVKASLSSWSVGLSWLF